MHANDEKPKVQDDNVASGDSQQPEDGGSGQAAADQQADAMLDEALDETFPASDPVSISPPRPSLPAARPSERWK